METEVVHPSAQTMDAPEMALIEEHVRRLLEVIGFSGVTVTCTVDSGQVLRITIEAGDEGRALIGGHGAHLAALHHIIRCVLRRQLQPDVRVMVDVNGYQARRERSLLGLAEEVARKAQRTGQTVVLQPMPAADRRMIHTALASHKDIHTESLGEEPNRRVVVRPVFL